MTTWRWIMCLGGMLNSNRRRKAANPDKTNIAIWITRFHKPELLTNWRSLDHKEYGALEAIDYLRRRRYRTISAESLIRGPSYLQFRMHPAEGKEEVVPPGGPSYQVVHRLPSRAGSFARRSGPPAGLSCRSR